jgi:hypothetical protein
MSSAKICPVLLSAPDNDNNSNWDDNLQFNRAGMVRAGVVSHPAMWSFSGYNEIQEPRGKNVLIGYSRLQRLIGAGSYDQLKTSHRGWVEDYLGEAATDRQDEWTVSIGACPVKSVCPI